MYPFTHSVLVRGSPCCSGPCSSYDCSYLVGNLSTKFSTVIGVDVLNHGIPCSYPMSDDSLGDCRHLLIPQYYSKSESAELVHHVQNGPLVVPHLQVHGDTLTHSSSSWKAYCWFSSPLASCSGSAVIDFTILFNFKENFFHLWFPDSSSLKVCFHSSSRYMAHLIVEFLKLGFPRIRIIKNFSQEILIFLLLSCF